MVCLRHFRAEDAEQIKKNMYPDLSAEEIRRMIGDWDLCVHDGRFFEMLAVTDEGRLVGSASLFERSGSTVSLGIEVFESERRRGIASEAMRLMTLRAAGKGYRLILDQVRTDNPASIRLHEKLGFESDDYVYLNKRGREVSIYIKLL